MLFLHNMAASIESIWIECTGLCNISLNNTQNAEKKRKRAERFAGDNNKLKGGSSDEQKERLAKRAKRFEKGAAKPVSADELAKRAKRAERFA